MTHQQTVTNDYPDELPAAVRLLLYGREAFTGSCGCTGQCGDIHPVSGCGCADPRRLTAAPADPGVPAILAATLPADELLVWCDACHLGATLANRPHSFGLDVVAVSA
jgi:hypothetical protein